MHDALRLLREEHELQADVMRKMDERVVLFETVCEREEESKNVSPQQQLRGPSKAKHEPKLVDLHGACGDGAGEKQLLQRQQLPQSPHLQEEQSSEDCYACNEDELPPKQPSSPPPPPPPPLPSSSQPPSLSPPLSSPPSPPPPSPMPSPPLGPLPPLYLQARSTARPVPESVATLACTTREEEMRDGITWPSGAGREVNEIASAMEHAYEYWNNVERAVVGTGGRVCTINRGSEHGRKRRRCPKRARVKEKGTAGHQRGL